MIPQLKLLLIPLLLKFKVVFAMLVALMSIATVFYIYDINQEPEWANKEGVEILQKSIVVTVGKTETQDAQTRAKELLRDFLLSSAMEQIINSYELDKKDTSKLKNIENIIKKYIDSVPINLKLETTHQNPLYTISREQYASILQDIYIEIANLQN
ncbi:hypothetical protein SAMN06313486_10197 [Epsilonproteobacteria bacterium SCGC AD-308-P11]|jgi:hypothetical protein|nr:hypothetical protein SAMN06313486_10197 [Epsilonproteobacteria bacterium SCGC AD-308-P11]